MTDTRTEAELRDALVEYAGEDYPLYDLLVKLEDVMQQRIEAEVRVGAYNLDYKTPRTKAGQRLLAKITGEQEPTDTVTRVVADAILAIEADAYDRGYKEGYHAGLIGKG